MGSDLRNFLMVLILILFCSISVSATGSVTISFTKSNNLVLHDLSAVSQDPATKQFKYVPVNLPVNLPVFGNSFTVTSSSDSIYDVMIYGYDTDQEIPRYWRLKQPGTVSPSLTFPKDFIEIDDLAPTSDLRLAFKGFYPLFQRPISELISTNPQPEQEPRIGWAYAFGDVPHLVVIAVPVTYDPNAINQVQHAREILAGGSPATIRLIGDREPDFKASPSGKTAKYWTGKTEINGFQPVSSGDYLFGLDVYPPLVVDDGTTIWNRPMRYGELPIHVTGADSQQTSQYLVKSGESIMVGDGFRIKIQSTSGSETSASIKDILGNTLFMNSRGVQTFGEFLNFKNRIPYTDSISQSVLNKEDFGTRTPSFFTIEFTSLSPKSIPLIKNQLTPMDPANHKKKAPSDIEFPGDFQSGANYVVVTVKQSRALHLPAGSRQYHFPPSTTSPSTTSTSSNSPQGTQTNTPTQNSPNHVIDRSRTSVLPQANPYYLDLNVLAPAVVNIVVTRNGQTVFSTCPGNAQPTSSQLCQNEIAIGQQGDGARETAIDLGRQYLQNGDIVKIYAKRYDGVFVGYRPDALQQEFYSFTVQGASSSQIASNDNSNQYEPNTLNPVSLANCQGTLKIQDLLQTPASYIRNGQPVPYRVRTYSRQRGMCQAICTGGVVLSQSSCSDGQVCCTTINPAFLSIGAATRTENVISSGAIAERCRMNGQPITQPACQNLGKYCIWLKQFDSSCESSQAALTKAKKTLSDYAVSNFKSDLKSYCYDYRNDPAECNAFKTTLFGPEVDLKGINVCTYTPALGSCNIIKANSKVLDQPN